MTRFRNEKRIDVVDTGRKMKTKTYDQGVQGQGVVNPVSMMAIDSKARDARVEMKRKRTKRDHLGLEVGVELGNGCLMKTFRK